MLDNKTQTIFFSIKTSRTSFLKAGFQKDAVIEDWFVYSFSYLTLPEGGR